MLWHNWQGQRCSHLHPCAAAANRYVQLMDALRRWERGKDVDAEGGAHGMGRAAWLLHDATTAQLLQDGFASDAVQYAVLQVGRCPAYAVSLYLLVVPAVVRRFHQHRSAGDGPSRCLPSFVLPAAD
jgi:hypothetical protein